MRTLPRCSALLMLSAMGAAAGCSRGPTAPTPASSAWPQAAASQPSAHQVFNDSHRVRGPEDTWVRPDVNVPPGALRVGVTTREDLLRLFGYPTQRRLTGDGAEVWYYASGLRPASQSDNPFTTRSQRIATQRKVVITFARDAEVISAMRTYVTGERVPYPFADPGPPFPVIEPEIIPARDTEPEQAQP